MSDNDATTEGAEVVRFQTDMAMRLLDQVYARIDSGDRKAQLLLTANAIVLGLGSAFGRDFLMSASDVGRNWIAVSQMVSAIISLGSSFVSAVLAVDAMAPRITRADHQSMLYHEDIRRRDRDAFVDDCKSANPIALYEDVLSQVHATSRVAAEKFRRAKESSCGLIVAFFFLFVTFIISAAGTAVQ